MAKAAAKSKKTARRSNAGRAKGPRGFWARVRRWALRLAAVCLAIIALPFLLVLVYALPFVSPPSTLMAWQALQGKSIERTWVPLEEMSEALRFSVITSEDAKFCRHWGVDFGELKGQVENAIAGEPTRGASTIPMQAVKNLFLWHGRSYTRKIIEMPLAMWADLIWSKWRMLEIYLNIVELGDGVFGVEQAGLKAFRLSAVNLNWAQSARIATSLPSPLTRNAGNPSRRHAALASRVQSRAQKSGAYVGCVKG
ncbi:MAG: transglycosylase domain-containing protein [Pseudomonadota bacterium]